ncbi:hypothetical protein OGAPHI_005269 [Ogataea philodendri]|uniref:Uncharacterized protein n=1 Tax=Ogataea philodendri TaxID=1378263 RepID=A0A9P8P2L9_9ASCO|nr:uncharacterized protein OGAPHI_005269 [Ogataea philodendri]KAH3663866.1 hypothetical protein OGAPHI_005269 [Ogataea philodendri]
MLQKNRVLAAGHVTLVHESLFVGLELARDRVDHAPVVEDAEVAGVPAVAVDVLWRDGRSHELVDNLSGVLELGNNLAGFRVDQLVHAAAVHLQVRFLGDRIGPNQWKLLDLGLLPLRKIVQWDLLRRLL